MKAIALTGLRTLEVQEMPDPRISAPSDVLMKIEVVGICGSDMHYFETGRIASRAAKYPYIIGHECSATVLETGSAVTRVKPGDRVAVDPAMSCFQCDQCRQGRPHTCRKLRFLGCPGEADGCMSEFLVMPESSLYPVDDRMTFDQAALCEPLSIGLYAVKLAQNVMGLDTAILGAGPIGHCVLMAAKNSGVRSVFMTDRVPQRVQMALAAGAGWAANPDVSSVVQDILQIQPGGLDVVFECAGQQETLNQGVDLLKPGGKLVIVGIPREDRVSFHIDSLRRKEITVINVRRQNECVQSAIDLVTSQQIKIENLATHHYTARESQEAFEQVAEYRDGVLKAMVRMEF